MLLASWGTVSAGQFDWGGFLPNCNGGARRYARRIVANHAESTFALLRYNLGGNRPSQTDPQALSPSWLTGRG